MVLVSNITNTPWKRGWKGCEPESLLLDGEDAPAPAEAEDGPGGEAAEETQAGLREAAHGLRGIGRAGGGERDRSDDPVRLDAESRLQHFGGPRRPGIDREIEDGEVEARRKLIGAHNIPIKPPVDGHRLLPAQAANVVDGRRTILHPRERLTGDAELGRSTGIAGMLNEAALVLQHMCGGLFEARWRSLHARSSQFRLQGDEGLIAEIEVTDRSRHAAERGAGLKPENDAHGTGRR
jgi:hypothetical protein